MENRLPDKRNSAGKWFDRPPISRHYIFPSILSLQQPPTHARPARHTLDAVKLAMQGDPRQSQVTVTTHSESSPRAVPPRPSHSLDMNLAHAAIPRSRHQPAPLSYCHHPPSRSFPSSPSAPHAKSPFRCNPFNNLITRYLQQLSTLLTLRVTQSPDASTRPLASRSQALRC